MHHAEFQVVVAERALADANDLELIDVVVMRAQQAAESALGDEGLVAVVGPLLAVVQEAGAPAGLAAGHGVLQARIGYFVGGSGRGHKAPLSETRPSINDAARAPGTGGKKDGKAGEARISTRAIAPSLNFGRRRKVEPGSFSCYKA